MIRTATRVLALSIALLAVGCHDSNKVTNVDPLPARVDGVYSVTGDGEVTIYWRPNQDNDIDHYKIYRNSAPTGTFSLIGTSTSTSFRNVRKFFLKMLMQTSRISPTRSGRICAGACMGRR